MANSRDAAKSLRRHALAALISIAIVVIGLGGWAATTKISGAVIAAGLMVVEGGSKRVQHAEGGIVAEILVENEDQVSAGQLLIRLDDTAVAAGLEVVASQLREALARQSRLIAESDGAAQLVAPPLAELLPNDAELEALYAAQTRLYLSRRSARRAQEARLDEQLSQIRQQISGLEAQRDAIYEQVAMFTQEVIDLEKLFEDNLVEFSRINAIRREMVAGEGEIARIGAEIFAAGARIAELEATRGQIEDEYRSEVLTQLQEVGVQISQLAQEKIAAEDRLRRLDIRAPIAGTVHESVIQTLGGVVGSGQIVMTIVPTDDTFVLDARVSPIDIDKVHLSQKAMVNLVGLSSRSALELGGTIIRISPDLTTDPVTNIRFYQIRVAVSDDERSAKLPEDFVPLPGMPADVYIQTTDRSVLSYLTSPLMEQLHRTFRED